MLIFTIITVVLVIAYDTYYTNREIECIRNGRYIYSVLIGIEGDFDDSIEDCRVQANWHWEAREKALEKYSKDNEVLKEDLIVLAIERIGEI